MSNRPKRFCNNKECKNKHTNTTGYCDEHKRERKNNERNKKESANLYNNKAWREYSKGFRLCAQICINFTTCGGLAECVDHIKPVEDGGDFWNPANHQALCNSCHARKSAKEGQIYIKSIKNKA